MNKKIISIIMSIMLLLNCVQITIFAEETTKDYIYDKYSVKYTVTNNWESNQNISVVVTNTSDEHIYNWALGFDAEGEILGLWNGTIYDRKEINHD